MIFVIFLTYWEMYFWSCNMRGPILWVKAMRTVQKSGFHVITISVLR